MKRALPVAAVVLAVAVVAWLGATSKKGAARPGREAEILPYQGWVAELGAPDQVRFAQIYAQLRTAERDRVLNREWPSAFLADPTVVWTRLAHGAYVNYLGVPVEPARPRWLVLLIEPEPAAIRDPVPPEDDEHHTLSDGTGIHVGVWTAPNAGPVPEVVLPFPAADGWTQRLRGL